jgi:hypothetical protein
MKHIRKYNEGSDNFDFLESVVDQVIDVFSDICDESNVTFRTSQGRVVVMKHQDYLDKNQNYKDFVEGLPIYGMEFTIGVWNDLSYSDTLGLMDELNANINRLKDIGWDLVDIKLNHKPNRSFSSDTIIDITFNSQNI